MMTMNLLFHQKNQPSPSHKLQGRSVAFENSQKKDNEEEKGQSSLTAKALKLIENFVLICLFFVLYLKKK